MVAPHAPVEIWELDDPVLEPGRSFWRPLPAKFVAPTSIFFTANWPAFPTPSFRAM